MKRVYVLTALLMIFVLSAFAAKVDKECSVLVNGIIRKYILYVPDKVDSVPSLVFSLHGASGHATDRSPFRTSVADEAGCIVVYPQGEKQHFPVFGGSVTGWNATGEPNEEISFFKAIIEDVASDYDIDRSRIYCCGFSNGGMMTYACASAASDIFAAFASISGFQLNEFHHRTTGYRPVPFLHIHGMNDDFVKYSCMPVICYGMVARNGCWQVPNVSVVENKYRCSVYEPMQGGFPYVYYEINGMGHNDFTDKTPEGNSAATMWNFMSKYTLDSDCDRTLKWRINIDEDGFYPRMNNWKVNTDDTRFSYGTPRKPFNADNNVYPSLQFEKGYYKLVFHTIGDTDNKMYVKLEELGGDSIVFSKSAYVCDNVTIPFYIPHYMECKITILKTSSDDRFEVFTIHSADGQTAGENCQNDVLPEENPEHEGSLIEIKQDQGMQYDDFDRTSLVTGSDYNTYTATKDLQIAFKMVDINVEDCDYILIRFAEPVKKGWHLAFWNNNNLIEVPEGVIEYKFELEQSMILSGILPQICMMTFFGGYLPPLIAKVEGVYKHSLSEKPSNIGYTEYTDVNDISYYSLSGIPLAAPEKGINIMRTTDGRVRKIIIR